MFVDMNVRFSLINAVKVARMKANEFFFAFVDFQLCYV